MLQREEDKKLTGKKHIYSSLIIEVQKLIAIRNQFAHYPLIDLIDPCEDSVIFFTKYRDGVRHIDFNQSQIDNLITKIRKATDDLFS